MDVAKSQKLACQDIVYVSCVGFTHFSVYTAYNSYAVKHSLAVSGLQYRLNPVFFVFCFFSLYPISASPTHSLVAL